MTAASADHRRRPSPGWARRTEATRRDLAEAAVDLFIRRGYAETSVDDIAAAAGVGRRTFFRYYPTKEDVFLQPTLDDVAQFCEALRGHPPSGDPLGDVQSVMREAVVERRDHLDDALALYRSVRATPELRGAVRSFNLAFEDGIASWFAATSGDGVDPGDPAVRLFAACAVAVREVALAGWAANPSTPLVDHLDRTWDRLRALR